MKRVFMFLLVFTMGLVFIACEPRVIDSEQTTVQEQSDFVGDIVAILENNGYNLTEHDQSSKDYFRDNTLADYGIDSEVTDLYMGDINGNDWIQLVGLETEQDAIDYATAILAAATSGEMVYRSGNAVLLTYSEVAYALFD